MAYYKDRKSALDAGASKYWTGEQCKHGHVSFRWAINGACVECQNVRRQAQAARYREAKAARIAKG